MIDILDPFQETIRLGMCTGRDYRLGLYRSMRFSADDNLVYHKIMEQSLRNPSLNSSVAFEPLVERDLTEWSHYFAEI